MSIETQHLRIGLPVPRRAFVRSGLIGALAAAVSPLAHSATSEETQATPQSSDTALLILDFQVGIGDHPYAKSAAQRAAANCSHRRRRSGSSRLLSGPRTIPATRSH